MNDLRFHCRNCREVMRAGLSLQGQAMSCPACKDENRVPRVGKLEAVEILFSCALCDQNLLVDSAAEGRVVDCPHCRESIFVPSLSDREKPVLDRKEAIAATLTPEEVAFLSNRSLS